VLISQRGKQQGRPPLRPSVDLAVERGDGRRREAGGVEGDGDEVLIDKYKMADEALIGERRYWGWWRNACFCTVQNNVTIRDCEFGMQQCP
jgi:hypothetical protein